MRIIAIEGIDGAGKTTVMKKLRASPALSSCMFTGEFESQIGAALKEDLSWLSNPLTKLYSFAADRALILGQISKSDTMHRAIIWERYIFSAFVYREAERRLGRSPYGWNEASTLNSLFPQPSLVIYMDLPVSIALSRRMGDESLLVSVTECYDELLSKSNVPHRRVDASRPPDVVATDIERIVLDALV